MIPPPSLGGGSGAGGSGVWITSMEPTLLHPRGTSAASSKTIVILLMATPFAPPLSRCGLEMNFGGDDLDMRFHLREPNPSEKIIFRVAGGPRQGDREEISWPPC